MSEYLKDHTYNIIYVDKDGNQKEELYTPTKNTSKVGIINGFKNQNSDFFKLVNITENKQVTTNTNNLTELEENNQLNTLFDYLESTDFEDIDITDKDYDMLVAYSLDIEQGDEDAFDGYLSKLAKSLKVVNTSPDLVVVDMTQYVKDNFDLLDELFDAGGTTQDEEIGNLVCNVMPNVISGYATDSIYNELLNRSKFTESKLQEEFEDMEDVDNNSTLEQARQGGTGEDMTETQENIEQAVSQVTDVTDEETLAVDTANSSLNVLIADEVSAIDGYKAFLQQCKETIIPSLYEVLETEINEIIKDEEDHINKLETIKASFHLDDVPLDESKKLNEQIITSSGQSFGDKYNELTDKMIELDREFGSSYGTIGQNNNDNIYKEKLDKIDEILDQIAEENKDKSDLDDVRILFDLGTIEQQEELRTLIDD